MVALIAIAPPYAEFRWFLEDARHPEVWAAEYEAKGLLAGAALLFSTIFFWIILGVIARMGETVLIDSDAEGSRELWRLFDFARERAPAIAKGLAVVLAIFAASSLSDSWRDFLLFRHAQAFGRTDPLFHLDLGFYVFRLPFLQALATFVFQLLFFGTLLGVSGFLGLKSASGLSKLRFDERPGKRLCSLLGFFLALSIALSLGLAVLNFGSVSAGQFTGPGYSASREISMLEVYVSALALTGLAGVIVSLTRGWKRFPTGLVATFFFAGVLILAVIPAVLNAIFVDPNRIAAEAPYATRALEMTRFGWNLAGIRPTDFEIGEEPSQADIQTSRSTLENMRLWDPTVVKDALEGAQTLKPYYQFRDVDVDRYVVDGAQRMVMLSTRDFAPQGLGQSADTWVNRKLHYTHGYGIAMIPVNTSTPMGLPEFLLKDMPQATTPSIPISRPQTYFGHFGEDQDYVIVHTKVDEFDYPSNDGETSHRWQGATGIKISSFQDRFLFSWVLSDWNLLITSNIDRDSRLLLRRDVAERVSTIYPFLTLDPDPYPVILDGRVIWLLDGYTTSDRLPYSQQTTAFGAKANYLRNPVKLTVDAYTGEVHAYVIDPSEPILKAWRGLFPRLFETLEQAPSGLSAHFRYPEGLFRAQAEILAAYHVRDAETFLTNGDAWAIPFNRGLDGTKAQLQPYYVQMRLPGAPRDAFMLILPFTPLGKDNMNGWLAAGCDPADYGQMTLYRFAKGALVRGPAQMETFFNQDEKIANINRQLSNEQSKIIVGNLLVIPIGSSVMYAEPLFLQSRTQGIQAPPELKKVILATKNRIVVENTYPEALAKLFENTPEFPSSTPKNQSASPTKSVDQKAAARKALDLYNQADAALRAGDFAKYGELKKQLGKALSDLAQ